MKNRKLFGITVWLVCMIAFINYSSILAQETRREKCKRGIEKRRNVTESRTATSHSNAGKTLAGAHFNVGYRVLDLKDQGSDEEKIITLAVWYPTMAVPKQDIYGGQATGNFALNGEPDAEGGPYPLLVFSHGYGGTGLGRVFLTEVLASYGWIVVAPDHHDRHSVARIRTGRQEDFNRSEFWKHAREIVNSGPKDREQYLYRLDEMKLVLDQILESEPFGKLIDKEKIAVGGHSFGGYTALGLCGTIKDRHDERIKAILLFSTGAGGYLFRESELAAVKLPSMYFLGERERDQTRGTKTMVELADKVYRNLSPPKYLLEIKGANHFSFSTRLGESEQLEVIRRYSIAFLEKHISKNKDANEILKQGDPFITRYVREDGE